MQKSKLYYTWEEFRNDMYGQIIPALLPYAREFAGVLGLPRGGIFMAVMISHQLEIPLVLWGQPDPTALHLAGASTRETEYEHHMTKYVSSWPLDRRILVADDIADTGKRLRPYAAHPMVTLFRHRKSIVEPTWWCREKTDDDGFIVFPWEKG